MSGHLGERLSALLDGEMSAADRAEAEAHLRDCAACARDLEELASVDALARELTVEAPAGYFEELPGRVRARVRARRRRRVAPAAVWAAAAAAVVMVAVVAPLALRRAPSIVPASSPVVPAATPAVPEPQTITAATAPPLDARRAASVPDALQARDVPARLRERDGDRLAKVVAADTARRDKLAAGVAVPAPAAEPLPATALPPAAPTAGRRAEGPVAQTKAEEKAVEAFSDTTADAVVPMAEMRKESDAAATPREGQLSGAGYARSAGPRLSGDERYALLLARRPPTAAGARALGKAWEAFAREFPTDRRADEARVRAIESAVTAWRLGGETVDLASARVAGRAYLDAESAPQRGRVRALLDTLPPAP